MADINFRLTYSGNDATAHQLDFYDAAQALLGFQRSLALTTHLVVNGEIITQAPALKGARIMVLPPRAGSWELAATILSVGAVGYKVLTAPSDTVLGHWVKSAYDYVILKTLGFHVDFKKTLFQQYADHKRTGPHLTQAKLDALTEKCEVAIRDIHRPIVWSRTATQAEIFFGVGGKPTRVGRELNEETYEQLAQTDIGETETFVGRISSYNMNTFKGRIFLIDEGRPIPFELTDQARSAATIAAVTQSLRLNATRRDGNESEVAIKAVPYTTKSGRLKNLRVLSLARLA